MSCSKEESTTPNSINTDAQLAAEPPSGIYLDWIDRTPTPFELPNERPLNGRGISVPLPPGVVMTCDQPNGMCYMPGIVTGNGRAVTAGLLSADVLKIEFGEISDVDQDALNDRLLTIFPDGDFDLEAM